MTMLHGRWRQAVSLLACDALGEREREAALVHLETCAACRAELAASQALFRALAEDPLRAAEPELPVEVLARRVAAVVTQAPIRSRVPWGWRWLPAPVAAAALAAVVLLLPSLETRLRAPTESPAVDEVLVSSEAMGRLERTVAREQTVRYLNQAQDLLVSVAAMPPACRRKTQGLDLEDETERSRALLARRSLAVDMNRDAVAAARPVLDDVEQVLREVAALPPCARREDLEAILREIEGRNLLMKIDLMTRELEG
jgi:hypothetical protein